MYHHSNILLPLEKLKQMDKSSNKRKFVLKPKLLYFTSRIGCCILFTFEIREQMLIVLKISKQLTIYSFVLE